MLTLVLVPCACEGEAVRRWARPVLDHWPVCGEEPALRVRMPEAFEADLGHPRLVADLRRHAVILLVVGSAFPPARLYAIVDRLQQELLAAALLFPRIGAVEQQLRGNGLIVESHEVAPARLAAMLFALAERQPAICTLDLELTVASRSQGGVRGEMYRLHEELNLAAVVQRELLPASLPQLPGVQFGVLFRPAGYVSGDIYDVRRLDEHHAGFFIADAVGHGVPAALLTMVLTRTLRMNRPGLGGTEIVWPGEAMTRLNDELCRGVRDNPRFSTAIYGVVNGCTRRVVLAGAGHPPPLRLRRGSVTRVPTDGPLLGIFPGEQYGEVAFTLAEDETLLLYSDGFETAFAPPDGEVRRRRSSDAYVYELAALSWPGCGGEESPQAVLEELARRLDRQVGSLHQVDDVTAVAVCPRRCAAEVRAAA